MITKGEFLRVQELLGRDGLGMLTETQRPESRPKTKEFALTGCITCAECGCAITAEAKTKRSKSGREFHYTYYHCTHRKDDRNFRCPQRINVEESKLEKQIADILSNIRIDSRYLEWAREYLKQAHGKEKQVQSAIFQSLDRNLDAERKKVGRLLDLLVSGHIDKADYDEKK